MRRERVVETFERGGATVILGDGFLSRMLALRLLLIHDRRCIICDRQRSVWSYIMPFAGFFCFGSVSDSRLVAEELCDLADIYPDGQKFIVITGKSLVRFSQDEMDRLESRYIFIDGDGSLPCSTIRRA